MWDIGSLENMGRDAIPTPYDANISGYTSSEYQSGIGYGNQLYMRGIYESPTNIMYHIDSIPSGNIWCPILEAGYFYLDQDEYYFYSSKYTTTGTPASGTGKLELGLFNDKYPQGPIAITSGTNEFSANEPFAKTYEPTPSGIDDRTTNKYRKVVDLRNRKDWEVDTSGYINPYIYTWESNTFTVGASGNHDTLPSGYYRYINAYPSGSSLTVEMECAASGWNHIKYVDLNPYNTYESYNTFLVVAQSGTLLPYLSPYEAELTYITRIVPPGTGRLDFICAVKDKWGAPVSGIDVVWDDGAVVGAWDAVKTTTIWDGTTHGRYYPPGPTSAGITITVTIGSVTDSIWIPPGRII